MQWYPGTADQLTAFSLNVSTSGFSVVGLEDVPWVPRKHPLNSYLAFITVQNSNESLMIQLFNIQKVACIIIIFKCTLFTFSQSKICYCSALSQLGTIPHHFKYKVLREPRSLSDAGAAG